MKRIHARRKGRKRRGWEERRGRKREREGDAALFFSRTRLHNQVSQTKRVVVPRKLSPLFFFFLLRAGRLLWDERWAVAKSSLAGFVSPTSTRERGLAAEESLCLHGSRRKREQTRKKGKNKEQRKTDRERERVRRSSLFFLASSACVSLEERSDKLKKTHCKEKVAFLLSVFLCLCLLHAERKKKKRGGV